MELVARQVVGVDGVPVLHEVALYNARQLDGA
jgi:hypothetical protein